jgi:hypothetical protein
LLSAILLKNNKMHDNDNIDRGQYDTSNINDINYRYRITSTIRYIMDCYG